MTEITPRFIVLFAVNFISIVMLCYGCYFRSNKNATVAGSFVLFGIGIFLITYLLHGVDMSMEFAFGLFAVFGMLRYRTDTISIKEMTYLFMVTAIALLCAVSKLPTLQLFLINAFLCFVAFLVDTRFFQGHHKIQRIAYERIENIKPKNKALLLADLRERTGLEVTNVEIAHIDFLRDTAELIVYYIPDSPKQDLATTHTNPVEAKS
ncbi:DUF4956 domain-containing protein [Shewanella inventionis]|uniref:DUF4956 domain-containing protein n=1 Tax=Shewanella inventionis TaxID=1738770 RepID=A0ABQ1J5I6_9GAMM|nr:DUF4956 domain-containing protein [Shewanella inventionis]MCL1157594.1 DUF4956 domain-containing protein [Shewanella inventionis]UAL41553.1 DUF4956 domain-containing protein [Shewanella inventionis]GGB59243.1 DUF4956 domain-containing protein [Shewanella inventionis]